jgi:hypothetical protein
MTILNDFLNIIPGASLIQAAVEGRKVTATDFLPGSSMAISAFSTVSNLGGSTGTTTLSPLTTSGERTSPEDNIGYVGKAQPNNNMMIYAGGAIGIIAIAGVTYMVLKKEN